MVPPQPASRLGFFRPGVLAFLGITGGDVNDGTQAIRLTDEQRIDWLRLIRSQNFCPPTFPRRVNHFGGARAALGALPALARRGGGNASVYSREEAEREIEESRKLGVALVAI